MKYAGMPTAMWALFARSFRGELVNTLGLTPEAAKAAQRRAKARYREIIGGLPEFERGDRFKMNIVSAAMFAAHYLNLDPRPGCEAMADYYERAMMIGPMRAFCRMGGRRKFSASDVRGMEAAARLRAADRNPYSWNMDFLPYPDGSGYEARFTRCGICALLTELGASEVIPAMCRLDYAMSEAGGATRFVREYTLAGGGPYCDCGYKRKG